MSETSPTKAPQEGTVSQTEGPAPATQTQPPTWLALIPRFHQKRYQKWSARVKKRTGIEIPWRLFPLLERFYAATQQLPEKRGLSEEEAFQVARFKPEVLKRLVESGILEIQQGFAWRSYKGEAVEPGRPTDLYRLSQKLTSILGWRFKKLN